MNVILAIDSGGPAFFAALWVDGVIVRQTVLEEAPHSKRALPAVRRLLEDSGITLAQCDAFAFGAGPGRFSGLRLACGLAQALAYALQRPLVAVPSLAALAQANYGARATVAYAALPAHRGHVYLTLCRRRDGRWYSGRLRLLEADNIRLSRRRHYFCGEGFIRYLPAANELSVVAPHPTAAAVAVIAADMLAHGETTDAIACAPLYLRAQVAQTIAQRRRAR